MSRIEGARGPADYASWQKPEVSRKGKPSKGGEEEERGQQDYRKAKREGRVSDFQKKMDSTDKTRRAPEPLSNEELVRIRQQEKKGYQKRSNLTEASAARYGDVSGLEQNLRQQVGAKEEEEEDVGVQSPEEPETGVETNKDVIDQALNILDILAAAGFKEAPQLKEQLQTNPSGVGRRLNSVVKTDLPKFDPVRSFAEQNPDKFQEIVDGLKSLQ